MFRWICFFLSAVTTIRYLFKFDTIFRQHKGVMALMMSSYVFAAMWSRICIFDATATLIIMDKHRLGVQRISREIRSPVHVDTQQVGLFIQYGTGAACAALASMRSRLCALMSRQPPVRASLHFPSAERSALITPSTVMYSSWRVSLEITCQPCVQ